MSIQVSAEHGVLVAPDDPQLIQLFPHARPLPTGQLIIPYQPTEVRILRNLGYEIPSPILHGYDWRGTVPFFAQKVTSAMLVVEPRAFVLNDMGTGKTRSVLFAFDWLRQRKLAHKMLVVAPLSTLNFTWAREVMLTMPGYKVGIVFGDKERRLRVLRDRSIDIFVINHDGVATVAAELSLVPGLDVLCLDEASVYRHNNTKKWKVMNKLVPGFKYCWALTGTPAPREPTDAYGIIKLVTPGNVKQFTHFRDELMLKVATFKWVPRRGAEQKLYKRMQPAVRFSMEDCVDIPPVTYHDHEVKLTPKQEEIYEALRKHCRSLMAQGVVTAVNGGVLLNKLLQVSSGCVYDDNHVPIYIEAGNRLATLAELIEQNDRKTIVFCPFIPLISMVADHLKKDCLVHRISGATSKGDRDKTFNHFQSAPLVHGRPEVIVAHPRTMAHGLTLTEANMIVWFAPITDLEVYLQGNARVVRPGQTSHVSIRHLVGSRVEQLTYRNLANKQDAQGAILEMFEE